MPVEKLQKKVQEYKEKEIASLNKTSGAIYTGYDQKYESNVKEFTSNAFNLSI